MIINKFLKIYQYKINNMLLFIWTIKNTKNMLILMVNNYSLIKIKFNNNYMTNIIYYYLFQLDLPLVMIFQNKKIYLISDIVLICTIKIQIYINMKYLVQ